MLGSRTVAASLGLAFTVWALACVAAKERASSMPAPSTPPALDAALRGRVQQHLLQTARVSADAYELGWAPQWPHQIVPILWAHPLENLPSSIPIAVLPKRLVTPFDAHALQTLVTEALPAPKPEHAKVIAQLALWFGDFGQPVGELVDAVPVSISKRVRLPRAAQAPSLTKRGSEVEVLFYAVDPELNRLYDCRVVIDGSRVSLLARPIEE